MARRGLKANALARDLKLSQAMVSRILSGDRQPERDLEPWAAILGLEGQEMHDFLVLGYLARSHPWYDQIRHRRPGGVHSQQADHDGTR
jgi:transcriptional regulator with XRE-family HTH domain